MDTEKVVQDVRLEDVAKVLTINVATLKERICNLDFTVGEFFKIKRALDLSDTQIIGLFNI